MFSKSLRCPFSHLLLLRNQSTQMLRQLLHPHKGSALPCPTKTTKPPLSFLMLLLSNSLYEEPAWNNDVGPGAITWVWWE